jgi:hypothetical protein
MQIQHKFNKNKHQIDDDLCINYIIIKIIIKKIINQNFEYNKKYRNITKTKQITINNPN